MIHIVRDLRNLFLVTISPAFLLLLLSYIFSFEVNQIDIVVFDLDQTSVSRRYVSSITADQDVALLGQVSSYAEIDPLLVTGEAGAALVIPPGFAGQIYDRQPAEVQAIIDGSDPFGASEAIGSLSARSAAFAIGAADQQAPSGGEAVSVASQAWYNAGMKSLPSMVPGLLGIVLIMPALALALALSREKETGTLEGLVATPVSGAEYLLGKLLAYVGTGLVSSLIALLVSLAWFRVPFRGSLLVYLLLAADYLLACMGATVVLTNFVKSQQSAMFIVLLVFIVPSFFLAGLITPVSTESLLPLLTSYALPSTHFVEISRVIFLKGLGLPYLVQPALILLVMGLGALILGLCTFEKKVA
jgi:ABC-2 type transport system permease protein